MSPDPATADEIAAIRRCRNCTASTTVDVTCWSGQVARRSQPPVISSVPCQGPEPMAGRRPPPEQPASGGRSSCVTRSGFVAGWRPTSAGD